jgi:hypothetical protein
MLKNYTDVRLMTDKFKVNGANNGDTGTIIEVWLNKKVPNNYLVEIYEPRTGINKAIIVVEENDIEPIVFKP